MRPRRIVVTRFFSTPKMSRFLYENHRGSPTLTLLNVLGVLGVLNMLMDASSACWALFLKTTWVHENRGLKRCIRPTPLRFVSNLQISTSMKWSFSPISNIVSRKPPEKPLQTPNHVNLVSKRIGVKTVDKNIRENVVNRPRFTVYSSIASA